MSPDVLGFVIWLGCIMFAVGIILLVTPKDH